MTGETTITLLIPDHGEALADFLHRVEERKGQGIVILSELEPIVLSDEGARERLLKLVAGESSRLRLATRQSLIAREARAKGVRVIDRLSDLERLLKGHPQALEAKREFMPHIWRQQLRSRLQSMGLLSLPKLRIWILIILSSVLLFFVVFRLLPSAIVKVWPREDTVTETVNIFLSSTGALATIPSRVRVMELVPIQITVDKTVTYDQISKKFNGTNAQLTMTIFNKSREPYWLKKGSRLQNEAGIAFKINDSVKIDSGSQTDVKATAVPEDMYGVIIGVRGNVPAGLRWQFPALDPDERLLVYAENKTAGEGGVTAYDTVLSQEDITLARKNLEHELLSEAKRLADERKDIFNAQHKDSSLEILYYDELTHFTYHDFSLPTGFIGQKVASVPVSGSITYAAFAYDANEVLALLSKEVTSHATAGRKILPETLSLEHLVTHVIDYEDDLSWIKLTVDLSGTEQYVLEPLSPTGAVFAKKVRDHIINLSKDEASRVVMNFPEVKRAEIVLWPPWSPALPSIASHISIVPVTDDR